MKDYNQFLLEKWFGRNNKTDSDKIDSLSDHNFIIDQIIRYLQKHKFRIFI